MQTFLPYPGFYSSADALDDKRLGKQRVECLQLLKGQWKNHPASRMWRPYREALAVYTLVVCAEWVRRGHKDTCADKAMDLFPAGMRRARVYAAAWHIRDHWWKTDLACDRAGILLPSWWGGPIHRTHQSNLVRKDPDFYRPKFPDVADDREYIWPSKNIEEATRFVGIAHATATH